MTSPETLYTKNIANELRFLLVTHTTRHTVWSLRHFEVLLQFWTGYGQIGLPVFGWVFGPQDG
jgi:hypothetical protein